MNDIYTMRTELANDFAVAGAKLLHFTATAGALAAIPETDPPQYVVAGTLESIQKVLPIDAPSHPGRRKEDAHPTEPLSWDEAPVAAAQPAPACSAQGNTITLSGHQLRMALDLINPDGPADRDQLDEELTFGVRRHRDDNGKEGAGMCCWNDDTDGVLPLDGEYTGQACSAQVGEANGEK